MSKPLSEATVIKRLRYELKQVLANHELCWRVMVHDVRALHAPA